MFCHAFSISLSQNKTKRPAFSAAHLAFVLVLGRLMDRGATGDPFFFIRCSTDDVEYNFAVVSDLVKQAHEAGAKLISLPECFEWIGAGPSGC